MDIPIKVVGTDEAEKADAVVCLLASEDPGYFRDNLTGSCNDCGRPVVFRPTSPKAPIKICMGCAVARGQGGTA